MGNRSKKPRKSKYIDDEAEKSGDDHSADECDHIGKEIDNFDYEDGFLVRDDEEVEFEEGKKKRKKVRLSEEEMRVTQDDLDLVREAKEAQEKKGLKRVTQDRRDDESDEESDSMDDFIDDTPQPEDDEVDEREEGEVTPDEEEYSEVRIPRARSAALMDVAFRYPTTLRPTKNKFISRPNQQQVSVPDQWRRIGLGGHR